jgi:hypothetical protein
MALTSPPAWNLPPDLVAAVEQMSARWVQTALEFLDQLCELLELGGYQIDPRSCDLSPVFLGEIAAVLQLLAWERQGIFVHQEAGRPNAIDAIQGLARTPRNRIPSELYMKVVKVWMDRFAWSGHADLNADVTLDDLKEDAELEAIASLLWAHRHDGSTADSPIAVRRRPS